MTTEAPSLDEFAANRNARTGFASYLDGLPDEVRSQLLESPVGHADAVRWLHSLGYERATQNMVSHWRRSRGWRK